MGSRKERNPITCYGEYDDEEDNDGCYWPEENQIEYLKEEAMRDMLKNEVKCKTKVLQQCEEKGITCEKDIEEILLKEYRTVWGSMFIPARRRVDHAFVDMFDMGFYCSDNFKHALSVDHAREKIRRIVGEYKPDKLRCDCTNNCHYCEKCHEERVVDNPYNRECLCEKHLDLLSVEISTTQWWWNEDRIWNPMMGHDIIPLKMTKHERRSRIQYPEIFTEVYHCREIEWEEYRLGLWEC